MTIGDALGYDRRALAELMPAIEAGLVAATARLAEEAADSSDR